MRNFYCSFAIVAPLIFFGGCGSGGNVIQPGEGYEMTEQEKANQAQVEELRGQREEASAPKRSAVRG
jgi:uncharacterized protein YceK